MSEALHRAQALAILYALVGMERLGASDENDPIERPRSPYFRTAAETALGVGNLATSNDLRNLTADGRLTTSNPGGNRVAWLLDLLEDVVRAVRGEPAAQAPAGVLADRIWKALLSLRAEEQPLTRTDEYHAIAAAIHQHAELAPREHQLPVTIEGPEVYGGRAWLEPYAPGAGANEFCLRIRWGSQEAVVRVVPSTHGSLTDHGRQALENVGRFLNRTTRP